MFGWFQRNHGLKALGGVALALFGIAQQAATSGLIKGPAAVAIVAVGAIVAAYAAPPGTPKAAQ